MDFNPQQIPKPIIKSSATFAKSSFGVWEAAFLIIILGLGGFYLIMPKHAELAEQQKSLQAVEQQASDLKSIDTIINNLYSKLTAEENRESINLLNAAIPNDFRPSRLYILINGLASVSGLTVGSIDVQPLSPDQKPTGAAAAPQTTNEDGTPATRKITDKRLKSYTVNLNMTGQMDQFLSFIKSLENNPRLFTIESTELGGGAAVSTTTTTTGTQTPVDPAKILSFRIIMKAYSYSEQ